MEPYIHLIIHNVASIVSAVTAIGVALFLFLNGHRKTANITFAGTFLVAGIFIISHVAGVNISDPNISRMAFMWNLSIFFIGAFNFHAVLAVINKEKQNALLISCVYASAFIITIFFLIFPDLFLLPSVPKMYFTNYYVPGAFNWVRVVFLYVIIIPFSLFELYTAYTKSEMIAQKKQLKYFMLTMVMGYAVALIPNFLIYDIQVDPLLGMLFVLVCAVPLVYGALQYELFNIQVIAKQAFLYSIAVGAVGSCITLLNYSTTLIAQVYPGFPTWSLALVSAVLAVSASVIVWKGLREGDLLKAEFITTVTHKFRTPLTYIKWASDTLVNPDISFEDRKTQVEYIRTANEKLVELTNILTSTSDAENKGYEYNLKHADLSRTVEEVVASLEGQFKIKHITIEKKIEPNLIARYDDVRIKFVIQVMLENALHYSNEGSTVLISTSATRKDVVCSVADHGVGMDQTQISLLFSKFFRSATARKLDTEGLGIGLYITERIIQKHGGKIWAESAGIGQGSTFHFSLPRAQ